jgi:hypothetical protein
MAVELAPPWAQLPDIAGVNVYRAPPTGAIQTPAIVYRPDEPWIDRQQTYRVWIEHYLAVCVVGASSSADGVAALYEMALAVKAALEADPDAAAWDWLGAGGIVATDQGGMSYLACAVRLTYRAEY